MANPIKIIKTVGKVVTTNKAKANKLTAKQQKILNDNEAKGNKFLAKQNPPKPLPKQVYPKRDLDGKVITPKKKAGNK